MEVVVKLFLLQKVDGLNHHLNIR